MSKRILIVTGDAGEGYEAWYAFHRFQEEGMTPVVASSSVKRLHMVLHDFEPGWDTYIEKPGYGIEATVSFDQVDPAEYDAVLVIGGRAPEFLRHNERLIEIVRRMDAGGKWIFAICHGIQVLAAAGVVQGRTVTCYEHVRLEVAMCGGKWDSRQAVRDGRVVTAQTWQSHPEFYQEVFGCLRGC
ncbi:MAG: DJ-1/PfpI family protein [Acidobacteria bacterium]|nr:DJ-1/PfpI family protein [Acidobacteriota bacterium]